VGAHAAVCRRPCRGAHDHLPRCDARVRPNGYCCPGTGVPVW
jgi:hypothetical protein